MCVRVSFSISDRAHCADLHAQSPIQIMTGLPFSPSTLHPPPCRNTQSNVWNSLFIAELNSNAEKQQAEHADIETLSTHQTHNKTHRHTVTHTDTEYPEYPLTYVDIAATPLCKPLRAPHSGRSAATKAFVAHRQFDCNCKIFAWLKGGFRSARVDFGTELGQLAIALSANRFRS